MQLMLRLYTTITIAELMYLKHYRSVSLTHELGTGIYCMHALHKMYENCDIAWKFCWRGGGGKYLFYDAVIRRMT